MTGRALTRDLQHAMIGGVCSGIARRYDFDVTLVRLVAVLLTVATAGLGIAIYVAAWVIMLASAGRIATARLPIDTPERLAEELHELGDRLAETARGLAERAREAAEEIAEIAELARRVARARAAAPREIDGTGVSLPAEDEPTAADVMPTPPPS